MFNKEQSNIIDVFNIVVDEHSFDSKTDKSNRSIDKALIECLNAFGIVDICYISNVSGLSVENVISELKGTIFQDPEPFLRGEKYDITKYWLLSSRYLSGNIRRKLSIARGANIKFPKVFESNIEKIKSILPEHVDIDDIHISLGAPWIPVKEIELFIMQFFKFNNPPKVYFYEDLLTYKIVPNEESKKSVLNNITYGVREDKPAYGSEQIKQYLTGLEIMEQTLNAKTVKVNDYIPKGGWNNFRYEAVFNQTKTIEAQNKQRLINEAFVDYVYNERARTNRFEQYYNDKLVGYIYSQYDGSFLKLPGLNPNIKLYKHQRDAIARVLLSDTNLLLAHDVGTGKTYEMIVSLHELKRMNISDKNLVVVPNNVLQATADAHKLLYKEDKILVVYPGDFTPNNRNSILEKIRDDDFTAIYMAYSSFDMIVMSKDYYINKRKSEISNLNAAIFNATLKPEKRALEQRKKALEKKLSKFVVEEQECPWLTFDKLGITTLVVDEAHNYKNIPILTRADGIVGMGGSSKKCSEMLEKAHFVDKLIFATGTPLTNSLADLFTFQVYLQPDTLKYHKINTFDTWINTFGKRMTSVECDVDSNNQSLRTMTRFSSFHNLSELMSLFSQVCDFHHADENEDGLPTFNGPQDICVPKSKAQHDYINELSERTELIRTKQVSRSEDNLLKVTIDGRLAALDIRLVDDSCQYNIDTQTKTEACADKVYEIYEKYPRSVQVVFSDIGTPKANFNVYDDLAKRLVYLGVSRDEIAFVHDATTERARARLFANMNLGLVRVVVGSTQKLGVGVNVQERLVALHHLSVPWRPADMVQREGRILRKGNTSNEAFIFRYITEGSFDAYSWQLLENKQRFISSFLSGTSVTRDIDDIDDAVLSYAEVKALAIGNPLIKSRVEIANKLERVKIVSRSRQREIHQLNSVVSKMPAEINHYNTLYEVATKDLELYKKHKESIPNDERIAFGEELLEALSSNADNQAERLFDMYQGFNVMLPSNMSSDKPYLLIRSLNGGCYRCDMELEGKTALGVSKSIDIVLEHLSDKIKKYLNERQISQNSLDEAKAQLKLGNPHLAEVKALKERLAEIDKELEENAAKNKKVS